MDKSIIKTIAGAGFAIVAAGIAVPAVFAVSDAAVKSVFSEFPSLQDAPLLKPLYEHTVVAAALKDHLNTNTVEDSCARAAIEATLPHVDAESVWSRHGLNYTKTVGSEKLAIQESGQYGKPPQRIVIAKTPEAMTVIYLNNPQNSGYFPASNLDGTVKLSEADLKSHEKTGTKFAMIPSGKSREAIDEVIAQAKGLQENYRSCMANTGSRRNGLLEPKS